VKIVTLDFETRFHKKDYTLKRMTTEAYIRDPRFAVLGCAFRWHDGRYAFVSDIQTLRGVLAQLDDCAVLCHHAHFDGLILSHHFGVKPHAWLDTLPMAKLLVGAHISVGLDSLARHFGLAAKSVPYEYFNEGQLWHELPADVQGALSTGGMHDCALTWEIFCKLAPRMPKEEYLIIDSTIRMFTEPEFEGDIDGFAAVWTAERDKKDALLQRLGVAAADLQSPDTFANLLRRAGVEPALKATKAGTAYAFAKTDEFMKEWLGEEHDNELARLLVEARLGVRSTIDQTRAERLGWMSRRGRLPVYLHYCGAHTTRWSGGDKVNFQNFKRGGGVRRSLRAAAGKIIIKADKSQVECRYLNMLAGQMDVIERFRKGDDPYTAIASAAYGHDVYKPKKDDPRKEEMETKRGTGKQLELSCGYGAGADTIVATAARGTYGPPVRIDRATGLAWRDLYRATHPAVINYWKNAESCLPRLAAQQTGEDTRGFSWSLFHFEHGTVWLPNGCPLYYPQLQWMSTQFRPQGAWHYLTRYGMRSIWGGAFVENLIQAVARVDMSQTIIRLRQNYGYRPQLLEHDAYATVVTIDKAEQALQDVLTEFRRAPIWCPGIPLDAEGSIAEHYS